MTRLALIVLCLATVGCQIAPTSKPAVREADTAVDCPAPKPPPDRKVGPFWPKRTLRAAFV